MNNETSASDVPDATSAAHDMVDKEIGARILSGVSGKLVMVVAICWSLFQLWIASPLQYQFDFLVVNHSEARSIHLAFAIFLTFMVCPAFSSSPRRRVPIIDWLLALAGAYCAGYLYVEYEALSYRPGLPTDMDLAVSVVGMLLLLESARRSLGPPLVVIASIFLFYSFAGNWPIMPDLIAHGGNSLNKVASHQWLSSEGVFGIALGVSTSFVFLFVLFGALLEKAGAGNYFIQVAFAMLGHLRGGPAKAAVLSSGMTGLVSGSSIANVVMTGTFTIPLMRRVGFSREKAGAVEVSSSVNGQIMPPVMGAAAFLMVEYVNLPYTEVVRHAFLPAIISYIALLYIVHIEALKQEMETLPKPHKRTLLGSLVVYGLTVCSILILSGLVYYGIGWVKEASPDHSLKIIIGAVSALYIGLLYYASRFPPLKEDDPKAPIYALPELAPTVKTGLHYLLPLVVLIWCLMLERLSPGLSAFYACVVLLAMLITQRPLLALFRKQRMFWAECKGAFMDVLDGLNIGARNMVGIGVATAAAGIIVGTVSLTSIGLVMTELVEQLSGGSFILVLLFTAVICVILGMGLPTTANYIVVSSLMAIVIQELGAKHGFYIPLIAIHMFVFYFGILADVTPPVGLASFAAAAVSGGDPIRTGVQAFIYSARTVVLPFFFIFNHKLLLIGVEGWLDGISVFLLYTAAILLFSSATQGWFVVRSRLYESFLLLLISSMIFIPTRWMALMYPPYEEIEPTRIEEVVERLQDGQKLHLEVRSEDALGDKERYYVHIPLAGETTEARMEALGLTLRSEDGEGGETHYVVDDMRFMGAAEEAGISFGDRVLNVRNPLPQPKREVMYGIAFVLAGLLAAWQWRRRPQKTKQTKQLTESEHV